jgi:uracil-DNA glycosylase
VTDEVALLPANRALMDAMQAIYDRPDGLCRERTARVQTLKCSPGRGRGTPLRPMRINCPPRYLRHELDVLRPGVLLVYGRVAAAAILRLGSEHDVQRSGKRFRRMALRLDQWACTTFMLTHPAHGGWRTDHKLLRASLADRPVAEN